MIDIDSRNRVFINIYILPGVRLLLAQFNPYCVNAARVFCSTRSTALLISTSSRNIKFHFESVTATKKTPHHYDGGFHVSYLYALCINYLAFLGIIHIKRHNIVIFIEAFLH